MPSSEPELPFEPLLPWLVQPFRYAVLASPFVVGWLALALVSPGFLRDKLPPLRWTRDWLVGYLWKLWHFSKRGPFFVFFAWILGGLGVQLEKATRKYCSDRFCSLPGVPLALRAAPVSTNSVRVRWQGVHAGWWLQNDRFEVQVRSQESKTRKWDEWRHVYAGQEFTTLAKPFECGRRIEVRVRALNRLGVSEWVSTATWAKQFPSKHDGGIGYTAEGVEYNWRQTRTEVEVRVPVKKSVSKKDIEFSTKHQSLQLKVCSDSIEGKFGGKVLVEGGESYWEFEDDLAEHERAQGFGKVLVATFTKGSSGAWSVLVDGGCPIDTGRIKYTIA